MSYMMSKSDLLSKIEALQKTYLYLKDNEEVCSGCWTTFEVKKGRYNRCWCDYDGPTGGD